MRATVTFFLLFLVLGSAALAAQDAADAETLSVPEAVIAADVVDRRPTDAGDTFVATIGRLYCWTRITGAAAETSVDHVWYYDGAEVSRVRLKVGSPNWRTWSRKTIPPSATGSWRVDVQTADGAVIGSVAFTIR